MHPCPCGYDGDRARECVCTPRQSRRARANLSGPLQDRLDIHIEVPPVSVRVLHARGPRPERSATIRSRVLEGRDRPRHRYLQDGKHSNAQLKPRPLTRYCGLGRPAQEFQEQAVLKLGLSARADGRMVRVARTIADLAGSDKIEPLHVGEATQSCSLGRRMEC
jgi:magnesium chelatase family protein